MEGKTVIYRQQKNFCSKPSCRKCREGSGHGPYWYAYRVLNGRTVRTYIGKNLPTGVKPEQIDAPLSSTTTTLPAARSAPLRLKTLGQFHLERRDERQNWQIVHETSWHQPQVRALLACLVCAPAREATPAQVCAWLWPELDAALAAHHLQRACAVLDQLVGARYFRHTARLLALDEQKTFWIDCTAFEDLCARAALLSTRETASREAILAEAMQLYGGPFLPDEQVAEWLRAKRNGLHQHWRAAMLNLVDLSLNEPRSATAISLLEQLLAIEPANEAAVQRLMFALAHRQRRTEALQVYHHLATLLQTTTQATPTPETHMLYEAIQQGNDLSFFTLALTGRTPGIAPTIEHAIHASTETQQAQRDGGHQEHILHAQAAEEAERMTSEISIGRMNQSPLVGRDLELETLHHVLIQVEARRSRQTPPAIQFPARRPHAHCLILMGEAGIGKTRLAEEGAREAQRRGWNVIWGRSYPQEREIPYRPWTAMLRSVLSNAPNLLQQSADRTTAILYQPLYALIPEMQERLVGAGVRAAPGVTAYPPPAPELEELRLREAIYTFLSTLSQNAPLLVVLDDIQWIDERSAQMFGYLARRMVDHAIVLLGGCREKELTTNRVLHHLLGHMQREQVVEYIQVQPLNDEQIGLLVSDLPTNAITHVQNQAAGNPFFAEELAYSLRTRTSTTTFPSTQALEETQALPVTIAAALDHRLKQLRTECYDLLGKAAVLGGSFDAELLAEIELGSASEDDEAILLLLEEALDAGILTDEGGPTHITYHFWHPLLATHLYQGLTTIRRKRLHLRVADTLRRIYAKRENEEAAAIARHLIRGGGDPARIALYAELAANHAYNLFAYPEAEHFYRITLGHLAPFTLEPLHDPLQSLPALPAYNLAQRLHLALLVERMADCARILGNFRDARNLYARVLQLRTSAPRTFTSSEEEQFEAQIQAMLWSESAWIWRYMGEGASARACYERGAEVLHAADIADGPAWGSLRLQRASLYWQEGYHEEALQAARQALDLFTQTRPLTHTLLSADEQTRIRRTLLGDPINIGRAHNLLGIMAMVRGELSAALDHLHQAMTINDQYEQRRESANVHTNTGHIHLMRGEFAQAEHFFQRALTYAEQSGDVPVKSIVLCNMAEMAGEQQRFAESERLYHESLALAAQMNDREYLSQWHAALGNIYREQGKFTEAAPAILRALTIGRAMPNQACIAIALIALANLHLALVEYAQNVNSVQGQRALRHAAMDLQRASRLRGLDAETRTRAALARANLSRLRGDLTLARQQAREVYATATRDTFKALQIRSQHLLATLPDPEMP